MSARCPNDLDRCGRNWYSHCPRGSYLRTGSPLVATQGRFGAFADTKTGFASLGTGFQYLTSVVAKDPVSFPDRWRKGSIVYDLEYRFEPGHPQDGVTILVPVPLLAGMDREGFDWLVPGLREELVTELIRTLPKQVRRSVVPAPDYAARALPRLIPYEGSLVEQLAQVLRALGARDITAEDFRPAALPAHLKMTYGALDKRGKIIDADKDLAALVSRQAGSISSSVSRGAGTRAVRMLPGRAHQAMAETSHITLLQTGCRLSPTLAAQSFTMPRRYAPMGVESAR